MAELIEDIKKNLKVQNDKSQTTEKYKKESYSTQSKTRQNALVQTKVKSLNKL